MISKGRALVWAQLLARIFTESPQALHPTFKRAGGTPRRFEGKTGGRVCRRVPPIPRTRRDI